MTTPYVGEIRLFGFSRVPTGWFACDGSLQSIAEYQTLYTLLGTTYGGDGISTFAVPDLRGAVPVHQGTGPGLSPRPLGLFGGTESVTLSTDQIPAHQHTPNATSNSASTVNTPGGNDMEPRVVELETHLKGSVLEITAEKPVQREQNR